MQIAEPDKNFHPFLHYVATKKPELADWHFLRIEVKEPDRVDMVEIEQLLSFYIQSDRAWLFRIPAENNLILFIHREDDIARGKFEQDFHKQFRQTDVHKWSRRMNGEGMEHFAELIAPHVAKEDKIANVLFARMKRLVNHILVLDDDPMVLRQMERMLSEFGNVFTLESPDDFYERYIEFAPDILFLDIHLRSAKGNELLQRLTRDLDPYAHTIMISSDTQQEIVMEIKENGAKGFVVKPLHKGALESHVKKARITAGA